MKKQFSFLPPIAYGVQVVMKNGFFVWFCPVQLPRPSRRFLHHPRREGDRQAAGNGNVSADGGEKRIALEKWAFAGFPGLREPP